MAMYKKTSGGGRPHHGQIYDEVRLRVVRVKVALLHGLVEGSLRGETRAGQAMPDEVTLRSSYGGLLENSEVTLILGSKELKLWILTQSTPNPHLICPTPRSPVPQT